MQLTFWRQYSVTVLEWVFALVLCSLGALLWPFVGYLLFALILATIELTSSFILSLDAWQFWVLDNEFSRRIGTWLPVLCGLLYIAGFYRMCLEAFGEGGIFELKKRRVSD